MRIGANRQKEKHGERKIMNNFLVRSRYAVKTAYYFCIAFSKNLIAEFLDRRLETKKRRWTALGTFGSGMVPLGKVNMDEATQKVSGFGTVVSIDVEQATVFYSERR